MKDGTSGKNDWTFCFSAPTTTKVSVFTGGKVKPTTAGCQRKKQDTIEKSVFTANTVNTKVFSEAMFQPSASLPD